MQVTDKMIEALAEMVDRFTPIRKEHPEGWLTAMTPAKSGEWVRHSDYEALERENAELRSELKLAIAEREFWRLADKNSVERAEAAEADRAELRAEVEAKPMTDTARDVIDGFCTDCGNWTALHEGRCGCGSGRVAVPPAGYRILSPGKLDNESLEAAAKVARECFDDPQAETDPDYVPAAIREMKEAGK